jgi:hypothetical protein
VIAACRIGWVVDSAGEKATGKDYRCVTVGQEKSLTGCAVQLLVQDLVMEAVVDTRAVLSILGTEQYGSPTGACLPDC